MIVHTDEDAGLRTARAIADAEGIDEEAQAPPRWLGLHITSATPREGSAERLPLARDI